MFNQITWREFIGFAAAVGIVAFFVGRATRTLDYPTAHDEEAREAVAVLPAAAAPIAPKAGVAAAAEPGAEAGRRPLRVKDASRSKIDPSVLRRVKPEVLAKGARGPQPDGASAEKAAAGEAPAEDVDFGSLRPSPATGPADPLVSVVICTDFQCPVCSRTAREMQPLIEKFKDTVRFEIKNNALKMHRNAERAAIAGLAAHRQGKFWHMHDEMFRQQQYLTDEGLEGIARSNGLNLDQFRDDIADPALKAQVAAETDLCAALGARGTPTFFVNGERHVGWGSAFGFERVIEKHLALAEEALAAGTPKAEIVETLARKHATEPQKYVAMMIRHIMPDPMK